ncbi:hypothetical protein HWV62_3004, partial [Athelia sp. TMB]
MSKSSPLHSAGCALRADGSLKDAEEIEFFDDRSDEEPLLPTSDRVRPAGNLDSFIRSKAPPRSNPATVIAGSRRSNRAIRPSAKVRDSAPSSSTVPTKRSCGPINAKTPTAKQPRLHDEADDDDKIPDLVDVSDNEDGDDVEDENEEDEDNERIKLMGDNDRKARNTVRKDMRSADLRLVFTEVLGRLNRRTGVKENGILAQLMMHASSKGAFQLGELTLLVSNNAGGQQTLDSSLITKPPVFTKEGLTDYIIELIVSEDDAILLVDKQPFRDLMTYLKPNLKESDMPHRTKTHDEIMQRARLVADRVKEKLE